MLRVIGCLILSVVHNTCVLAQKIQFEDVTERAGLVEPLIEIQGHGGAWGDFDGDGLLDLYVGGFCDRPKELFPRGIGPTKNRLMRNRGDGTFERVQQPAVEFYGRTSGAVFADLNNDGLPELYVANNGKGKTRLTDPRRRAAQLRRVNLFQNQDGKLIDISDQCGACPETMRTARNIGVFDYNNDGLLDLLVIEDKFTKNPRSALFRNLGNLRFREANAEVGLPDDIFGLGLAVADLNEDGRPDFFVGHSNRMFLSTSGGKYVESPELTQLFAWTPVNPRDKEDWPCGAAFCDLNRDGRLDMVLSIHHERARNRVYLNQGVKGGIPQFRDVSAAAGLPAELPDKSPHVEIQDFDNDGLPDLYFSTAWKDEKGNVTPLVMRNTGQRGGVPRFVAPRKIAGPMVYYPAGPSGDYDRDGRVDLFLINWFFEDRCHLLRNVSSKNHWLDVQVVGKQMNRMGIGAQVKLYQAGQLGKPAALLGFQEITTGYGYASGQEAICHFGLGKAKVIDVLVKLPNGKFIKKPGVKADQRLVIEESK